MGGGGAGRRGRGGGEVGEVGKVGGSWLLGLGGKLPLKVLRPYFATSLLSVR